MIDLIAMNKACSFLLGEQDFTSFSKANTQTYTNNCNVMFAKWEQKQDELIFSIKADRFLRNMVRAIVGTLLTEPTDEETLQNFYIKTRPFGTWGKFKNNLDKKQQMAIEAENKRDIFSTFIAVPWQVTLFLFMMSLMFKTWTTALILGGICGILTIILYFSWYKHLSTNE